MYALKLHCVLPLKCFLAFIKCVAQCNAGVICYKARTISSSYWNLDPFPFFFKSKVLLVSCSKMMNYLCCLQLHLHLKRLSASVIILSNYCVRSVLMPPDHLWQRCCDLEGVPVKVTGQGYLLDCSLRYPNSGEDNIALWKLSRAISVFPCHRREQPRWTTPSLAPHPPISNDGWTNWCRVIGPFILSYNSGFHI